MVHRGTLAPEFGRHNPISLKHIYGSLREAVVSEKLILHYQKFIFSIALDWFTNGYSIQDHESEVRLAPDNPTDSLISESRYLIPDTRRRRDGIGDQLRYG